MSSTSLQEFCAFVKKESSSLVDMLVLESERLIRKQLCASACSLRKFGEAVDNSLLLTKIVRIRCKTLIERLTFKQDLLFFLKDK